MEITFVQLFYAAVIATAITSCFRILYPALWMIKEKNPNTPYIKHIYSTTLIWFVISIISCPFMFIVLMHPKLYEVFVTSLVSTLSEKATT